MTRSTIKLTLVVMAFSAVGACSLSEVQAEVRRGLLYDIFHFGRVSAPGTGCDPTTGCGPGAACDPCTSYAPSHGLEGWLGSQLEAEKWRVREDVRFYRMHFFLQNQDKKKLLHRECNPFQDCYWGYYPTCWRSFPRGPQYSTGPLPGPESMPYETDQYPDEWDADLYEPGPDGPAPELEILEPSPVPPKTRRPTPHRLLTWNSGLLNPELASFVEQADRLLCDCPSPATHAEQAGSLLHDGVSERKLEQRGDGIAPSAPHDPHATPEKSGGRHRLAGVTSPAESADRHAGTPRGRWGV